MRSLSDQIVLWIYCFLTAFFVPVDHSFVIASLAAVIYVCANRLARTQRQKTGLAAMILFLAVICPKILLFTPLILYTLLDAVHPLAGQVLRRVPGHGALDESRPSKGNPDYGMPCGPSLSNEVCPSRRNLNAVPAALLGGGCFFYYASLDLRILCLIVVGSLTAIVMGYQTEQYDLLDGRFRRTRDDSVEKNLLLKEKNQSILKNQDYEIYTATLKERNRIAREIHDNVGHMLSRGILMVGAMKAVHGDGNLQNSLTQLEETLNAAMTSVRESVHDLHDEAVSLREALESLAREYTFCRVKLEYDMGYDVPREIRYGFISIVKEALHNVMKHSDATQVRIVAREHPGLYQLVVEDNGTGEAGESRVKMPEEDKGIGIRNMKDRVDAFGGNIELQTDRGWRIYITVPKKAKE